jgi:PEP-CTERM motif
MDCFGRSKAKETFLQYGDLFMKRFESRKKWLFLSALSAGGMAVGGVSLAGVILTPVNQNVGNFPNDNSSITLDLPGINDMRVFTTTGPFTNSVRLAGATGATYFKVHRYNIFTVSGANPPKFAQPSPAGQLWGAVPGTVGSTGNLAAASHTFQPGFPPVGSDRYFDFQFADSTAGGALRYGWLEAIITKASNPGFPPNVEVDVVRYAYDDTGAQIGPPAAVPEPASIVLGGLGALVMGAAGVRRWRKNKQLAVA